MLNTFCVKTYKPGFVMVTALITALHVLTLGLIMVGAYAPLASAISSGASH